MGAASSKRRTSSPRETRHALPGDLPLAGPLRFDIPSDPSRGRDVQARILSAMQKHRFGEDEIFAVKISLEEAMINAIRHGNKLNSAKHVRIEAKVGPKKIEIQIEDEGPGFDRRSVPDPTASENLCKCSGRGILMMETYMDRVTWSKNGRRVKMIKTNGSRSPQQP